MGRAITFLQAKEKSDLRNKSCIFSFRRESQIEFLHFVEQMWRLRQRFWAPPALLSNGVTMNTMLWQQSRLSSSYPNPPDWTSKVKVNIMLSCLMCRPGNVRLCCKTALISNYHHTENNPKEISLQLRMGVPLFLNSSRLRKTSLRETVKTHVRPCPCDRL